MTRTTIRLLLCCQYLIFLNAVAGAEHRPAITLPEDDWLAIEHCLGIIRQCQMEDGMIRIKGAGDPVWTVPYVSNFAAMALLAANDQRPNSADAHRVERWLLWYANNQNADGTIDDQEGIVSAYKSNGRRDSTDSYAATFLMAASRYQQAIRDKPAAAIDQAANKASAATPDGFGQEDTIRAIWAQDADSAAPTPRKPQPR